MAASLSIEERYLAEFKQLFNEVVTAHLGPEGVSATLMSDGELVRREDFSLHLADQLAASGPWGKRLRNRALMVNLLCISSVS